MLDLFTKLSDSLTTRGPSEKWLAVRAALVTALYGYRLMLQYARQRTAGAPASRYPEPPAALTDRDIKNIRAASGMNRRLGTRLRQIRKSKRDIDADKKTRRKKPPQIAKQR